MNPADTGANGRAVPGNNAPTNASYAAPDSTRTTTPQRAHYHPFEHRDKSAATKDVGALLHLIKGSLGSGILGMPFAYKNGGIIFSFFGTIIIGVLCTHCIYELVRCSQVLSRRVRQPCLGFADTAAAAFATGPRCLRPWAPFAKEFVNTALFCTYYCCTSAYVVLVAQSFKQVADNHTEIEHHLSEQTWIVLLLVALVPLGVARTLRVLVPFSTLATGFILIGVGCTMLFVVRGVSLFSFGDGELISGTNSTITQSAQPLPPIESRPFVGSIARLPQFFSIVLFAMEGIGTVLPIENSMYNPQKFLGTYGVLNKAMSLVITVYAVAGFLGYWRFGEATKEGSITLNLPNDLFAEIVKTLVALSILFSYGLMFCVPSEIVWSHLEPKLLRVKWFSPEVTDVKPVIGDPVTAVNIFSTASVEKTQKESAELRSATRLNIAYYVMRIIMIVGTVIMAYFVPNLTPFMSLIGSVFLSVLGLFCPAVIYLVTFWEENENDVFDNGENYKMTRWTIIKNFTIMGLAGVALVAGAHSSFVEIMAIYSPIEVAAST